MGQKNKGTLIKPSINSTLSTCNRHRSPVLTPDKGCRNPYGLVPRPLIVRGFILTEMVRLIQIEIVKKSEVKGPGDITPPKIQITSRELSL
jgi:hypothetical protein